MRAKRILRSRLVAQILAGLLLPALVSCGAQTHIHTYGSGIYLDADTHTHTCLCGETEAEAHDFTETVTRAATCTETGVLTHTCRDCGYSYTATLPCTDAHTWDEGTVRTPATCTEAGTRVFSCTEPGCNARRTEEIPATGHDFGELIAGVMPTCAETGEADHYTCRTCGACFDREKVTLVTTLLGTETQHIFGEWIPPVAPTCTERGVKGHYTCLTCGVNADEHFGEMITVYTCLFPHRLTLIPGKEANCLGDGNIACWTCSVCHGYFADMAAQKPLSASQTILPGGMHTTPVEWQTDDSNHWRDCAVCHERIGFGAHDWDEGNIIRDATATEEGQTEYLCRICGKPRIETFPYDGVSKVRIAYVLNGLSPALRTEDPYTVGYVPLTGGDVTVTLPDLAKATLPERDFLAGWTVGDAEYPADAGSFTLAASDLHDGDVITVTAVLHTHLKTLDFDWLEAGSPLSSAASSPEISAVAEISKSGSGVLAAASDEHDHTTGEGISARLTLDQRWVRMKFYNIYDRLLTEEDVGRQITVSFWLYSETPVAFLYGLMGAAHDPPAAADRPRYGYVDASTTIYGPTANRGVTEAGQWKQFTFSFVVDEYMLSTTCCELPRVSGTTIFKEYHNPALLGIIMDTNAEHWPDGYPFTGASGMSVAEPEINLYIDDIVTISTGKLDVPSHEWDGGYVSTAATGEHDGVKTFTCVHCGRTRTETFPYDPHASLNTFEDRTVGETLISSTTEREVNGNADCSISATGSLLTVTDACDHTTGTGKCVSYVFNNRYSAFKLYNIFDHLLNESDVGARYEVTFWARSTASLSLKTGLMSAPFSTPSAPPSGFTFYGETIYEPTLTSVKVSGEWQKFSFTVTVTEEMLSSTCGALERGTVSEYQNPALLGLTVNRSIHPNFPKPITLYIDDVEATVLAE